MNMFERLDNDQHFPYNVTKQYYRDDVDAMTRIVIKAPHDIMWIYSLGEEFVYAWRGDTRYNNLEDCIAALNAAEKYKVNV